MNQHILVFLRKHQIVRMRGLFGFLGLAIVLATMSVVPVHASSSNLEVTEFRSGGVTGIVRGVEPANLYVSAWIFLDDRGWYPKAQCADLQNPISSDGRFDIQLENGGDDAHWSKLSLYVVPKTVTITCNPGYRSFPTIPSTIESNALAEHHEVRSFPHDRELQFSNMTWYPKGTSGQQGYYFAGPGDNYFSSDSSDVFVDQVGALHLKAKQQANGKFTSAEVLSKNFVTYGKYEFVVDRSILDVDKNMVGGFFTYATDAGQAHHEVDIEVSRFGDLKTPNLRFGVQQATPAPFEQRKEVASQGDLVLSYDWQPDAIFFSAKDNTGVLFEWMYPHAIKDSGDVRLRINLWPVGGGSSDGKAYEMIVKSTRYTPTYSVVVNGSSFTNETGGVAPGSIASLFGSGLSVQTESASSVPLPTILSARGVAITDSVGNRKSAGLFFVSPAQINFLVPEGLVTGLATVQVLNGNQEVSRAVTQLSSTSPGFFTTSQDGKGHFSGYLTRVLPDGTQRKDDYYISKGDGTTELVPIRISTGEDVYMTLFGTGLRNLSYPSRVVADIACQRDIYTYHDLPVTQYVGAQAQYEGLDQVNLKLTPLTEPIQGSCTLFLKTGGNTFSMSLLVDNQTLR